MAPAAPTVHGGPVERRMPNEEEVALGQRVGAAYGTPVDGFTRPGAKMHTTADLPEAVRYVNDAMFGRGDLTKTPVRTVDQPHADQMMQMHLATQQSPLAALGFDPHRMVHHTMPGQAPMPAQAMPDTAPLPPPRPPELGPGNGAEAPPAEPQKKQNFTMGGLYDPRIDMMWTDGQANSGMHESMHRGFMKLRAAGKLPAGITEEMAVRALMERSFGEGVEIEPHANEGNKQIMQSRGMFGAKAPQASQNILTQLEAAAAELIAQERPRGPR
jgi:type IV secretory pathway VirB10-like protein